MKALVAVVVAVTLSQSAFARIGETLAECKKRYGEPVEEKHKTVKWVKGNVEITATFNGISADRGEGPTIKDCCSSITQFSEKQIQELKEANGLGCKWGRFKTMEFTTGKYYVTFTRLGKPGLVFIVAPLKRRWPTDEEVEPKKPNTKGF